MKLPSRWIRSRGGSYAYVIRTSEKNAAGERLYRLRFLGCKSSSRQRWTLAKLQESGVRWLKNKPRGRRT